MLLRITHYICHAGLFPARKNLWMTGLAGVRPDIMACYRAGAWSGRHRLGKREHAGAYKYPDSNRVTCTRGLANFARLVGVAYVPFCPYLHPRLAMMSLPKPFSPIQEQGMRFARRRSTCRYRPPVVFDIADLCVQTQVLGHSFMSVEVNGTYGLTVIWNYPGISSSVKHAALAVLF